MLRTFESRWPIVSIILLLILLISIIFLPEASGLLAITFLILGLSMTILFISNKQMQNHRAGQIDRTTMLRNIFVEVTSLLLAVALAALVARWLIAMANLPSMGWLGIAIAIILSVLVGLGARWLVHTTWGRLAGKTR